MKSKILFFIMINCVVYGQAPLNFLNWGDALMGNLDYVGAVEAYENYLQENPGDITGYLKLATVHGRMGEVTQQQFYLQMASSVNPFSDLYIDPAFRAKHLAKKKFEYLTTDDRSVFRKPLVTSQAYQQYFNEIVKQHTEDDKLEKIIYNLSQNNLMEASLQLEAVESNDGIDGIVEDLKGLVALKSGLYQEAIGYFTKAINKMPDFPMAYHNRAICYKLFNQVENAERDLKRAIDLNKNISIFYFTLGKLNEIDQQYENAYTAYNNSLTVNEEYYEALANYSLLLKGLGDYGKSRMILEEVIALEPDKPENLFLEANLNFTFGEFTQAIDNYSRFLSFYPDDPDALYNRGISRILMRQNMWGCADIEESLRFQSDEERARLFGCFCAQLSSIPGQ